MIMLKIHFAKNNKGVTLIKARKNIWSNEITQKGLIEIIDRGQRKYHKVVKLSLKINKKDWQ